MKKALVVGAILSLVVAACASPSSSGSGTDNTGALDDTYPTTAIAVPPNEEGDTEMEGTVLATPLETPTTTPHEEMEGVEVAEQSPTNALDESGQSGPGTTETSPGSGATSPSSEDSEPIASSRDLPSTVQLAIEDLAQLHGISVDAVQQISHRRVTWPDSSLGCPKKDRSYTQVLTPGTVTILEAGGVEYFYHADISGEPFLCIAPTDPVSEGPGSDL